MKYLYLGLLLPLSVQATGTVSEERCGWVESYESRTLLVDNESSWLLAVTGGHEAEGMEKLPALNLRQTDGSGSATCACLDVVINHSAHWIDVISGARALPPSACRNDRKLPVRNWAAAPPSVDGRPIANDGQEEEGNDEGSQGEGEQGEEQGQQDSYGSSEIQIFLNYQGYSNYSIKYVSTFIRMLSASWLYPSLASRRTAACYKGDPEEALLLFEAMVEEMNAETGLQVVVYGNVYMDHGRSGKPALQIRALDDTGRSFLWFERLRECDRWSTEQERDIQP